MTRAWRLYGAVVVLWLIAVVVYFTWEILRQLP